MITQWLLDFCSSILDFFIGLIPADWTPPGWFEGAAGAVTGWFDAASLLSTWVPIDFALLAALALVNAYIGGGVVKGIRILVSHFTGGGGSAA